MRYGVTLIIANYITSSEWLIQFPNPSGVEWYYLWDCSVMDKKHDTWSSKSWSSIHISPTKSIPRNTISLLLFLFSSLSEISDCFIKGFEFTSLNSPFLISSLFRGSFLFSSEISILIMDLWSLEVCIWYLLLNCEEKC